MREFREWAVKVVAEIHDPDWVMPVPGGKSQRFAFSLEAYNHFAQHSVVGLRTVRNAEELHVLLKRHAKHLYKGESTIRLSGSEFFILPNGLAVFNFKRNR
jgi:hypothetical protein